MSCLESTTNYSTSASGQAADDAGKRAHTPSMARDLFLGAPVVTALCVLGYAWPRRPYIVCGVRRFCQELAPSSGYHRAHGDRGDEERDGRDRGDGVAGGA